MRRLPIITKLLDWMQPQEARFAVGDKITLKLRRLAHMAPHINQQKYSHTEVLILPSDRLEYYFEDNDYYFFVVHANRAKGQTQEAPNGSVVYINKDCFLNLKYITL